VPLASITLRFRKCNKLPERPGARRRPARGSEDSHSEPEGRAWGEGGGGLILDVTSRFLRGALQATPERDGSLRKLPPHRAPRFEVDHGATCTVRARRMGRLSTSHSPSVGSEFRSVSGRRDTGKSQNRTKSWHVDFRVSSGRYAAVFGAHGDPPSPESRLRILESASLVSRRSVE